MDLWQNFPDPTYVRDADGRLLCVFARREEYAENPRRDFDHPDHLAMFGDLDWLTDGAGIRRRDPEGVLRSLLEDACTPEEVVAFVAEGGLTDHELVGSPFGPHPLLVGYEGTGYTGKLEGDGALDCIRELVEAGRRAPSLEGATEPDLWDAFEAGPVDGFALIPCPWPTGDYLLVDETDPDCAPSVEATRDLRLLGGSAWTPSQRNRQTPPGSSHPAGCISGPSSHPVTRATRGGWTDGTSPSSQASASGHVPSTGSSGSRKTM